MAKKKMQAPKGLNSATIEGHEYEVPKNGLITVISETHIETLKRHGFVDHIEAEDKDALEIKVEGMDDKDELVEFIEERGGEADNSMGLKKLKRRAREAAGIEEAE